MGRKRAGKRSGILFHPEAIKYGKTIREAAETEEGFKLRHPGA